ncbi:hypothetical protein N431DRAFT_447886 [Stipitochalara longipes BDJ]|nr:hypothetical protein N431DRAFT_447886 [Stipitochalara longipes BDJ]
MNTPTSNTFNPHQENNMMDNGRSSNGPKRPSLGASAHPYGGSFSTQPNPRSAADSGGSNALHGSQNHLNYVTHNHGPIMYGTDAIDKVPTAAFASLAGDHGLLGNLATNLHNSSAHGITSLPASRGSGIDSIQSSRTNGQVDDISDQMRSLSMHKQTGFYADPWFHNNSQKPLGQLPGYGDTNRLLTKEDTNGTHFMASGHNTNNNKPNGYINPPVDQELVNGIRNNSQFMYKAEETDLPFLNSEFPTSYTANGPTKNIGKTCAPMGASRHTGSMGNFYASGPTSYTANGPTNIVNNIGAQTSASRLTENVGGFYESGPTNTPMMHDPPINNRIGDHDNEYNNSPVMISVPEGPPVLTERKEPEETIPTAIVIKNIPFMLLKEELEAVINTMGLPKAYALNYHFFNRDFRGLAFANYHSQEDAEEVIRCLNGTKILGRELRVEPKKVLPAHEREKAEKKKRELRGQTIEQHQPLPDGVAPKVPDFQPPSETSGSTGHSHPLGNGVQPSQLFLIPNIHTTIRQPTIPTNHTTIKKPPHPSSTPTWRIDAAGSAGWPSASQNSPAAAEQPTNSSSNEPTRSDPAHEAALLPSTPAHDYPGRRLWLQPTVRKQNVQPVTPSGCVLQHNSVNRSSTLERTTEGSLVRAQTTTKTLIEPFPAPKSPQPPSED